MALKCEYIIELSKTGWVSVHVHKCSSMGSWAVMWQIGMAIFESLLGRIQKDETGITKHGCEWDAGEYYEGVNEEMGGWEKEHEGRWRRVGPNTVQGDPNTVWHKYTFSTQGLDSCVSTNVNKYARRENCHREREQRAPRRQIDRRTDRQTNTHTQPTSPLCHSRSTTTSICQTEPFQLGPNDQMSLKRKANGWKGSIELCLTIFSLICNMVFAWPFCFSSFDLHLTLLCLEEVGYRHSWQ